MQVTKQQLKYRSKNLSDLLLYFSELPFLMDFLIEELKIQCSKDNLAAKF